MTQVYLSTFGKEKIRLATTYRCPPPLANSRTTSLADTDGRAF